MDILSQKELDEQIAQSKLAKKYNEEIDSDSAYEMLNRKISRMEEEEVKVKKKSSTSRSSRKRIDPVVKVLTSATFIRGVFGILNKVFKK